MAKGTPIVLNEDERKALVSWIHAGKTEHRLAERARMILALADGHTNQAVAADRHTRPARVSKWRTRFADQGLAGLTDAGRDGRPPRYDVTTERRILAVLDEPPPTGSATWTGTLVAQRLGDVHAAYVWQVLRQHRIQLQRRRSWCVSTDPEFAPKAADIVGLYLDPPEHAMVLCVDEKPAIQALERAQGWLRLPNGKALTGYAHGIYAAWDDHAVCGPGGRHRSGQDRSLHPSAAARIPRLHERARHRLSQARPACDLG